MAEGVSGRRESEGPLLGRAVPALFSRASGVRARPSAKELAAVAILAGAWALRLWAVQDLRVSGDEMYSVYLATISVHEMVADTARDSHPPLYYLLLALWGRIAGFHEVTLRFLSIGAGMIALALSFALMRSLTSARIARLATGLLALSPFLLLHDRSLRPYALWVSLSLLLMFLGWRWSQEPQRWRYGVGFGFVGLLALYTYYFSAVVLAGIAVGLLFTPLRRQAGRMGLVYGVMGLLFSPWALASLGPSIAVTAANLTRAPAAPTLLQLWQGPWLAFHAGVFVERPWEWAIGGGMAALWLLALPWWARGRGVVGQGSRYALLILGASVVLLTLLYLLWPSFNRARYYLALAPLYAGLQALLLDGLLRRSVLLGLALALAFLAPAVWGLGRTYALQPQLLNASTVSLTEVLKQGARSSDGIVFHSRGDIGDWRLHGDNPSLALYHLPRLREEDWSQILERHQRVWLSFVVTPRWDTALPIERWFDENAFVGPEWSLWEERLRLYGNGPSPSLFSSGVRFGVALELMAQGVEPLVARPGESLAIHLRWRALEAVSEEFTPFVHLADERGQGWVSLDGAPQGGLRPPRLWIPGEVIDDRRLLLLPSYLPPGQYRILVGWHGDKGDRLEVGEPGGLVVSQALVLRTITVLPLPLGEDDRRASRPLLPELRLQEAQLQLGLHRQWDRRVLQNRDVPQLARPPCCLRPGDPLVLTAVWQVESALGEDVSMDLYLRDQQGSIGGPLSPLPGTDGLPPPRWPAPAQMVDRRIVLLAGDMAPGKYRLELWVSKGGQVERILPVGTFQVVTAE